MIRQASSSRQNKLPRVSSTKKNGEAEVPGSEDRGTFASPFFFVLLTFRTWFPNNLLQSMDSGTELPAAAIADRGARFAECRGAGGERGRLARGKPAPFPSLAHCAPCGGSTRLEVPRAPRFIPVSAVSASCSAASALRLLPVDLVPRPPLHALPNPKREFFFVLFVLFVSSSWSSYLKHRPANSAESSTCNPSPPRST